MYHFDIFLKGFEHFKKIITIENVLINFYLNFMKSIKYFLNLNINFLPPSSLSSCSVQFQSLCSLCASSSSSSDMYYCGAFMGIGNWQFYIFFDRMKLLANDDVPKNPNWMKSKKEKRHVVRRNSSRAHQCLYNWKNSSIF